jgi:hypothetical protein
MSTAQGGKAAENAVAGLASELKDWKVIDVKPTMMKGRAWESEVAMAPGLLLKIQQAFDRVRPTPWEPDHFEGQCYFVHACARCHVLRPCAPHACVKESFVNIRCWQKVVSLCTQHKTYYESIVVLCMSFAH